jgi:hypothetical protein
MSIRTTVTLDDDVAARVTAQSKKRGVSFKATLNEIIRDGLLAQKEQDRERVFNPHATPMGLRSGLSYDNIEDLLSYAEGENHR